MNSANPPGARSGTRNPLGKAHITIRMTVISAFVLATVLTAAIAIGLQYYFGHRLATDATRDTYTTTASGIAAELRAIGDRNRNLLELLAENTVLAEDTNGRAQLEIFIRLMRQNPLFYGVYLGRADGHFYEVINLESNPNARSALQARPDDRWVILKVDGAPGERQRHFSYLDDALVQRWERSEATDYAVASRSWYVEAMAGDQIHRSEPYVFAQLDAPGQTSSMRVAGTDTVVAIDMTLDSLSRFLDSLKISRRSEIFIYNQQGEVIAANNGGSADREHLVQRLLTIAADPLQKEHLVEMEHNGEAYYAFGAPLSYFEEGSLLVGILAPTSAVMGPFLGQVRLSILITGGFLLLLLPLSWFFSSPIVKPIRQLAVENDKVRRREYNRISRVPTHVTELDELSESMVTMVGAIQDHEKAQEDLMDAIIQLVAQAIDDKSPYTGGHCERVPELAMMLAEHASRSDQPPFRDFRLETDDQWREYRIAAWLHDCGKITTPEHVVDKGSKLETIYNRIHEVRMRFEVLWRDAEITYWKEFSERPEMATQLQETLTRTQQQLQKDFAFIASCNVGGEFMDPEKKERLRKLADTTWQRHFDNTLGLSPSEEIRVAYDHSPLPAVEKLLSDKPEHIIERSRAIEHQDKLGIKMDIPEHMYNQGELYNLLVSKGTLTTEERFKINEHMISTIKMLENLPFPEELKNVPRFASTHHETLDGTGYPRMLSAKELSIEERILAIADVFEALTAADRPYKKAKTVGEAIAILHNMVQNNHLDRDCFELFIREEIYLEYAHRFLPAEQINTVDTSQYLVAHA